jgi:thioredoxin reductase
VSYDCLIVGGGVAGLSAAIHLAWHQRKVLVLDRRSGPLFFTLTKLENIPGIPAIKGVELQKQLLQQAKDLGAEHQLANIVRASGQQGDFVLESDNGERFNGKTLLLATGVARYHPLVDGDWRVCLRYAGKCNMLYCPDCEAPEVAGKRTLVISTGSSRGGVGTAKHLWEHTQDLSLLLTHDDPDKRTLRADDRAWLEQRGITYQEGSIKALEGKRGCVEAVLLADGTRLVYDKYFVSSPKVPRSDLAQQLGLPITPSGHIEPASQRGNTTIEGVWIAGDVRPMTQQVAVAMGTGNIAAVHIDQSLI